MSRRVVGVGFCAIAAFFFGLRYLVAAQLMIAAGPIDFGDTGTGTDRLDQFLGYTGEALIWASVLALLVGVAFLVWAEIDARRERAG
jgi:hypothetical protein